MTRRICPDGGTCHHYCGVPTYESECFRVNHCEPLSGVYPDDNWPDWLRRALRAAADEATT